MRSKNMLLLNILLLLNLHHAAVAAAALQAAPFVTGGFALCHLSGACKLSNSPGITPAAAASYPLLLGAAKSVPCGSQGRCGPSWGSSSSFGYMLNPRTLQGL
jgi:hypothetical protein